MATSSSPLFLFLTKTRHALLSLTTPSRTLALTTFVLGNPSADLDSFISAVVYAFHTSKSPAGRSRRLVFPIINLPKNAATDLWRLRPEFGTALKLATDHEDTKELLNSLITVGDARNFEASGFSKSLFPTDRSGETQADRLPLVLVDHNALSIPTIDNLDNLPFNVTGCIDHHVDESQVPQTADPRIIRTGIGSCTSLVVQHLREAGLWNPLPSEPKSIAHDESDPKESSELAKLALSAILIDTANLTAEGKVSDTDREAVKFLEEIISNDTQGSASTWDREAFYREISASKESAVDLLTMPEILERDYKEWTETPSSQPDKPLRIGISSIVKPLAWLSDKASSSSKLSSNETANNHDSEALSSAIASFTAHNHLNIFGIMMASTSGKGGAFQRELLLYAPRLRDDDGRDKTLGGNAIDEFEKECSGELELEAWTGEEQTGILKGAVREGASTKIWRQRNVKISRKGVAPMLRECAKKA
ncbi:MAG: hypothetical protein Q9227_004736 [Pyrenula ochraceoflavens]